MLKHLQTQLKVTLYTLAALLGIGTFAFRHLEGWTWISSFYFAVTTLTTVGFGDLYPTSDASRLFTSLYILFGVGIMLSTLGMLGTLYLKYRKNQILCSKR